MDVLFITKSEEFLASELHAIVCDDGVWDSRAMDDVEEEQHGLLEPDHRDRSGLYPLCKLVYGDKQVGIAPERPFERSDQIETLDCVRPCDGDCLECLDRQVGLSSVVLTPFVGAHNLFGVSYCGRLVEALMECVSDQGSMRGMVIADPTVDIAQQPLPLFDGDAAL